MREISSVPGAGFSKRVDCGSPFAARYWALLNVTGVRQAPRSKLDTLLLLSRYAPFEAENATFADMRKSELTWCAPLNRSAVRPYASFGPISMPRLRLYAPDT